MTQATIDSNGNDAGRMRASANGVSSTMHPATASAGSIESGDGVAADPARRRRAMAAGRFPVASVVAGGMAVHLLAAALTYNDLVHDLYALFDATPRLLVLEHGLARLTATSVFLPPVVPTLLVVLVTLWIGKARQDEGVARWLALAIVPLAIDSVTRAVGVLIAPAPANIGDLFDLPSRFSLGPRLLLDMAGVHPGPAVGYWAVVCTAAAMLSAFFVARAVLAAEALGRAGRARRRRRKLDAFEALQAGVAVVGTWVAIAFAGQVALPFATQLFLKLFG